MVLSASPVRADAEQDWRNCVAVSLPKASIEACTRLLSSGRLGNANRAVTYFNRGNAYFNVRKYEEAVTDYDQAIRLNPKDAAAYFNRGDARYNLRQYREAIADYDQVIRRNPKHVDAYFNRGDAYYNLGFWQISRIKPNKQQCGSRRNLGVYRQAIADYSQVIRLDPKHAAAYFSRGLIYRDKINDRPRAIADLRAAHRLEPWRSKYAMELREMGVEP